ncbi:hypothetical protein Taro_036236 [Colocasia esculenta]|uniref:Uncharacterized protein n=1 Tax=Colocasia esculenta TaxID=4460 RepID=A0A843WL19_COLES|nr:hypothetical protein [Colocasia esculenta]
MLFMNAIGTSGEVSLANAWLLPHLMKLDAWRIYICCSSRQLLPHMARGRCENWVPGKKDSSQVTAAATKPKGQKSVDLGNAYVVIK